MTHSFSISFVDYKIWVGFLPVTSEKINEITAKTKNTISSVLPISIETPATPVAPSIIATKPNIKNATAARTIKTPYVKLFCSPFELKP